MSPAPAEPSRRTLSLKKKIVFSTVAFVVASPLIWLCAEVTYRVRHSIPLTGGRLYEDDMRLADAAARQEPWTVRFLSRFQKSDNPILFYEPRPGYDDTLYAINTQGFRDREFSLTRDADVFRIVVLGDSIIWGHGLEHQQTYAKQLEVMLNTYVTHQFEVLNFGVSGYSTQQEVELYRVRASKFNPDLIIVGYCLNDYTESSVEGQAFKQLYYDIFSRSYVLADFKSRLSSVAYNKFGTAVTDDEVQHNLQQQFELLKSCAGDTQIVIVVFPVLIDFEAYPAALDHHLVAQATQGLGFQLLDLLNDFRQINVAQLVQNEQDQTHPNAFGMAIAASATLDLLIAKQLIPGQERLPEDFPSDSPQNEASP